MSKHSITVYVYENWSTHSPQLLGTLFADSGKGRSLFSFEYDTAWLKSNAADCFLDPDLQFYAGRQYAPPDKSLFGLFTDSCPDRWGRLLMQRRENIHARKESQKPKALDDLDFLLGVYDNARMGALRFSLQQGDPFLSDDAELSTPPWVTLRSLEAASLAFENDDSGIQEKWLDMLIAPGSSLGGARPKATVEDPEGALWIAKFPSKHDDYNAGAWEKTVHDLARLCHLNVPDAKLESFSKTGSTFLVKRFDRNGSQRVHFSSAMTLLGKQDGEKAGYLDIASFIKAQGAEPEKDLVELWRRIVFNMAVSNTDDHLRNHGFLLSRHGWVLSPLYDVNPIPYGDTLTLNVSDNDNTIDRNLAIETAKYYGISPTQASAYANDILETVGRNWKPLAERNGLQRNAIVSMEPAFSECAHI